MENNYYWISFWIFCGIVTVINIFISWKLYHDTLLNRSQKIINFCLLWCFPIIWAIALQRFLKPSKKVVIKADRKIDSHEYKASGHDIA